MSLRFRIGLLVAALVALSACGGGGGGGAAPPAALNVTSTTMPDGVVGSTYNATIGVTGGSGTRNFTITAGALPAGLSLNASSGAVTGTPTGPAGTVNFTITVTDSSTPQQSDSQAISFDVNDLLAITTVALAEATIGAAYNQQVAATGGSGTLVFTISAGAAPAGIAMSATGTIAGTPTGAAANQTFTVRVADGSLPQQSDTQSLTLEVLLEVLTTSLPDASGGAAYNQSLQARGGQTPYSWGLTAGNVPPGLANPAAATGAIIGTPNPVCTATTSTFTAQVTDSDTPAEVGTQAGIGITVNPVALNVTSTNLPNGVVGLPYDAVVQVTGGVPPYAFSTTGTLPSQLGPINPATGAIAGTPDTVETGNFTVNVMDDCGDSDSQALSITVNPASLGRNDSIGTATTLTNGRFTASISPLGHPASTVDPDEDFYRITTTAASTVTIAIESQFRYGSPLDSVIEIVAGNGARLNTCVSPAFNSPCVHDDNVLGQQLDSTLVVSVSGATTFFVHVVDFRGDARPDFRYDIVISGIN